MHRRARNACLSCSSRLQFVARGAQLKIGKWKERRTNIVMRRFHRFLLDLGLNRGHRVIFDLRCCLRPQSSELLLILATEGGVVGRTLGRLGVACVPCCHRRRCPASVGRRCAASLTVRRATGAGLADEVGQARAHIRRNLDVRGHPTTGRRCANGGRSGGAVARVDVDAQHPIDRTVDAVVQVASPPAAGTSARSGCSVQAAMLRACGRQVLTESAGRTPESPGSFSPHGS